MRKFCLSTGLVLFIWICLGQTLKVTIPFYYGNIQLAKKIPVFAKLGPEVNTLFFGNSTIHRQLDPSLFDSHTRNNTKSFNLGTDATSFEENYFIIENLLKYGFLKNTERIFLAIDHSMGIADDNMHTLRSVYYHDIRRLSYLIQYNRNNYAEIWKNLISFVENNLGIYRFRRCIQIPNFPELSPYSINNFGYEPLNIEANLPGDYSFVSTEHSDILKRIGAYKGSSNLRPASQRDQEITRKIYSLKSLLEQNNIELVCIFLPNNRLFFQYDENSAIYLGDGPDFKEFFAIENRFNFGHLNEKGNYFFTKRIAQEYNKLSFQ